MLPGSGGELGFRIEHSEWRKVEGKIEVWEWDWGMKKREARREFHQESHLAKVMNFPFLFLLLSLFSLCDSRREERNRILENKKEMKEETRNVGWNRNSKLAGLTESKFRLLWIIMLFALIQFSYSKK